MYGRAFVPEIQEFIRNRDFKALREAMVELLPADLADALSFLNPEERAVVFRMLPTALAADIFEYLEIDEQEALLRSLGQAEAAAILNEMAPDDRTALLEELPGTVTRKLISLLTPEERRVATMLLGYPEGSIGRRMTPDYVSIREEWTVAQVIEQLRRFGRDSETMNILYVVDVQGKLLDDIRLREVILAPADRRVTELMDNTFAALNVNDDQEVAVERIKHYDRVALPVVDSRGILVGIVTVDDVLDVAAEETTEDIHKLGAVVALDEPYIDTGFFSMVRKRAVWLCLLFLGEMLTVNALSRFSVHIEKAVVLTLFIPLIISSGGNSGSQATTLIIRSLALGEIGLGDWWRIMRREVLTGLCLGGVLGSLGFLRILLGAQFSHQYAVHVLPLGFAIAFALVCVVLWGTLVGSMLPLLLRRIGLDPAVSSAPLVATMVDVIGVTIYFGIAVIILRGHLL
ncbi:MAG TPA: magnesium transporter [Candidatus Krumholzibacteria bacterium]|nr:magnesium transporter [Candidatus Krumholzibacteria bacterium]